MSDDPVGHRARNSEHAAVHCREEDRHLRADQRREPRPGGHGDRVEAPLEFRLLARVAVPEGPHRLGILLHLGGRVFERRGEALFVDPLHLGAEAEREASPGKLVEVHGIQRCDPG